MESVIIQTLQETTLATTNITDEIQKLVEIMATLRLPNGCPWDQKQTPETLKPYILEEAYELLEAIDSNNSDDIRDELGDLLLQVVFVAQIYKELNEFGLAEVAKSIRNKLIRRHPHVFADADADVNKHAQRWEEIKQQERSEKGKGNNLLDRIPENLPALKKATKVAKKITTKSQTTQVINLQNHFSSLSRLIEGTDTTEIQLKKVLGEIFFDTVQLTNSLDIDAEDLLRKKTMQVITDYEI